MNYETAFLAKLEGIITTMGGVVPAMTTPSSFDRRSLELLDAIATASSNAPASALLVGSSTLLPYPVTLSTQLYTDPSGWLWYAPDGGSIGNAASGSTVAIAKLQKLYFAVWEHLALATPDWSIQTFDGLASTAGASALADWEENKRLFVPDQRGRVPILAGQGAGLTVRAVGARGGQESHSHPLSDAGQARVTGDSTNLDMRRVSMAAGIANHRQTMNSAENISVTHTLGVGLSGNTDLSGTLPPWSAYTVLWFTGERA